MVDNLFNPTRTTLFSVLGGPQKHGAIMAKTKPMTCTYPDAIRLILFRRPENWTPLGTILEYFGSADREAVVGWLDEMVEDGYLKARSEVVAGPRVVYAWKYDGPDHWKYAEQ